MYAPFFGLQQEAFSIAPDPRFLYLSAMHREALAHLLYGLQGGGGFVLLTGEVGSGKTTVCRCFLEQIPADHRVGYVYNPKLTVIELLQTLQQEFGYPAPAEAGSVKAQVDALNAHLLDAHARGEHCLLVIDEAQGLSSELLEQLRLLTNLETHERKLLQIVLIGQPELRAMLTQPELRQLDQRVIARVHLGTLSEAETAEYVQHRLAVAGLSGPSPFDARALREVQRLSGGVPRRINLLCQRALLGAYALGTRQVTVAMLRQAAHEVFGSDAVAQVPVRRTGWALAGLALAVLAGVGAWQIGSRMPPVGLRASASVSSSAPAASATSGTSTTAALAATPPAPFADEASAWPELGRGWGLSLPADDACTTARSQGLACHRGEADAALLRTLARPALLQRPDGRWWLLTGLGPQTARLRGPEGEARVPLSALQAAWNGRYALLWRPPPGWAGAGERLQGEAADWALQQLTTLQGPARAGSGRYARDEALRQRVFAFQLSQQLTLDGVAGPVTLMQLNRAAGVDEPKLDGAP